MPSTIHGPGLKDFIQRIPFIYDIVPRECQENISTYDVTDKGGENRPLNI